MRISLEYGKRYRATVIVGSLFKSLLSSEEIDARLRSYQLAGTLTELPDGYQFEGVFKGKSGSYDLPEVVVKVEFIG